MELRETRTIVDIKSELQELLTDSVESGASVGFLTPVGAEEIKAYWDGVESDLISGSRKVFVAHEGEQILGCVQLSLCPKANGSHRGEVEKLMVHTDARGQGIARQLMSLLELSAAELGLSLLILDTRLGDVASDLYRSMGFVEAGQIPEFARSSSGELEATVFFYKLLQG